MLNNHAADISLYIHVPFCHSRCSYCDFNTYASMEDYIPDYIDSLCGEVEFISKSTSERIGIKTIYFGGGTPSLVPVEKIRHLMGVIRRNFNLINEVEVSIEANPGTVKVDDLIRLKKFGINRLSLGMQSAHKEELKILGRQHEFMDVVRAVKWARKAGFDNINLDLIYGIPKQSLSDWQKSLELAVELNPDHLSLYALTIEEGTPLYQWILEGKVPHTDDDLAADMYELASEYLETRGWHQYEISNWTRLSEVGKSPECKHNLQYWHNLPYLGLGCGAHGYLEGYRLANKSFVLDYIQAIQQGTSRAFPLSPATEVVNHISRGVEMEETMMLGLRLVDEGVSNIVFFERFGMSLMDTFRDTINALLQNDLVEWAGEKGERLRLTRRGRLLGNQVFMQFVGGEVKV